ncbi:MAG: fused MFS/spermidine synthase [Pseudomonadota bacterium]
MASDRIARFWAPAALLLSSAGSMALEIAAGRLMAPYVGMSLYSWTAIIAVVLAGLSVGHWIGGVMADRSRRPALWSGRVLLLAAALTFLSLFILRESAGWALGAFAPLTAMSLLAMLAFFAPSLAAGVLSPLLTKMALDAAAPEQRGRVLGRMFALGAAGAILGTVASGFFFISWVGSYGTVLSIAGLYAVLAAPVLAVGGRAAVVAICALAAAGPLVFADLRSPCDAESSYFCIRVDDAPSGGAGPARVLALDHLAHSVNARNDPEFILSPYVQLVDEIARRRFVGDRLDAFFVGGGAFTLPRAWDVAWPDGRRIAVEIDPEVTRVAQERLWFAPSDRLEIVHGDARAALQALPRAPLFDVVFGDAFHDVAIPQHLVTDEMHAEIAARLKPGGLYMINVVEAQREPPFLLSLALTLRQRFSHVELWIDPSAVTPGEGRTTWVVVASDEPTGLDRIRSRRGPNREWRRVPTDAMLQVLPSEELVILTDDFAPVNRLMRHVLLDPSLVE